MDTDIPQLLAYCQADPVFFENPARIRDRDSLFAVPALPARWNRGDSDMWVVLRPPAVELPEQGWKIHVSSTPVDAQTVCERVLEFCFDSGIAVKYLRSRAAFELLNSKYADRGSSGKLLTIYPENSQQFSEILPRLAARLRGFTGPYILTDLRFEQSPVYARYGAFRPMAYTAPNGDFVYAIRDPDGRLVPDDRSPSFTMPEWIEVPEVLRSSLAARDAAGDEDFPFQIERPIHFSNAGGVYLAKGRDSGPYVVLREARPYAGLDADGVDAVERLGRERDVLRRLDGLQCVPRLIDYLTVWEHHFLVEEYIEGRTLMVEVFDRYPLVGPDPAADALAEYTRWANDLLAKVDHALMSVHSRGLRFADLHPGNIIVRPDGSVALVDFELACDLADPRRPGLATPGFTAPAGLIGRAADHYVLNCLRQWVFLPISPLTDRDPVKLASLTEVISSHFPVAPGFASRMVRQFSVGRPALGADIARRPFDAPEPDWPGIRDSIAAGILSSATPDRTDRIFPGDPQQFVSGGFTVAYGAAGVLWALQQVGCGVPAEHVDWLVTAARRSTEQRPGLLDGLHGVAMVLDALGRRDDALDLLGRARSRHDTLATPGIHSGHAGAGLSMLHFFTATDDEELRAGAVELGTTLARNLTDDSSRMFRPDGRVGLQHGLTGVGFFFLRLYEATGEQTYLDLAGIALRREVQRGDFLPDGTFQLLEANRYHAYLGTGSLGLALVVSQYQARRDEPAFAGVVDGARRACQASFIRHPFLFMGRAGIIAGLELLGVPQDRPVVRDHIRRLGWHALTHPGGLAFPGNQLLRLSMDLVTGSAGILAALGVAFDENASIIPGLDLRVSQVVAAGGR
jgi:serine/threonine protein kinase